MQSRKVKEGFINAGHVGGRATQAKSYWDQLLPIDDVALLLKMKITTLKERVCAGESINGLPAPKPCLNENDKMFFHGQDIHRLMLAGSLGGKQRGQSVDAVRAQHGLEPVKRGDDRDQ
jgi:hypothetical protein